MKIIKVLLYVFIVSIISSLIFFGCTKENAENEDISYTVSYSVERGGEITGKIIQNVKKGESATEVKAIPKEGYVFVKWSDGITTPERTDKNITENITVQAIFEKSILTINYCTDGNGKIDGESTQQIPYKAYGTKVSAIPNDGYVFIRWSDGKTSPERTDYGVVKSDILIAYFEKTYYTVTYNSIIGMLELETESGNKYMGKKIDFRVGYGEDCEKIVSAKINNSERTFITWSDGIKTEGRQEKAVKANITLTAKFGYKLDYIVENSKGGRVEGDCNQIIEFESNPVEAVADEGYVFCGWSDMKSDKTHNVFNIKKDTEIIAYFEPLCKVFKFNYGENFGTPLPMQITMERNSLYNTNFPIPQKEDYVFRGWYADSDYNLQVVHENGKLMLGTMTLNLDTDTLYARWEKIGEEKKTFKILVIMVDQIYASLYSYVDERTHLIDYKMSAVEQRICYAAFQKVSEILNEWFEGRVIFELDLYVTNEVQMGNSFTKGLSSFGVTYYHLMGDRILEIQDIINEYDGTVVDINMNDYNCLFHYEGGIADAKHASVRLDNILKEFIDSPCHHIIDQIKNCKTGSFNDSAGIGFIATNLHELAHTIEVRYNRNTLPEFSKYTEYVYPLHDYLYPNNDGYLLKIYKQYFLKQCYVDGEAVGIPVSFWEDYYNL